MLLAPTTTRIHTCLSLSLHPASGRTGMFGLAYKEGVAQTCDGTHYTRIETCDDTRYVRRTHCAWEQERAREREREREGIGDDKKRRCWRRRGQEQSRSKSSRATVATGIMCCNASKLHVASKDGYGQHILPKVLDSAECRLLRYQTIQVCSRGIHSQQPRHRHTYIYCLEKARGSSLS